MRSEKLKALILATYPREWSIPIVSLLGVVMIDPLNFLSYIKAFFYSWLSFISVPVINVIEDWKIDEINRKNLFIHEHIKKKQLIYLYISILSAVILFTWFQPLPLQVCVFAMVILGILYSLRKIRLKEIFIVNYFTLACIYALIPLFIGIFSTSLSLTTLHLTIILLFTLFTFFAVQIKDFEDVKGDRKGSTLVYLGIQKAKKVYIFYHLFFYFLLLFFITLKVLPLIFSITFITFPFAISFLLRLLKAKKILEFKALHTEHHLITGSIWLSFLLSFIFI